MYRYKRYDDVRLVFAPEEQIAFYGGDPDNFEYPRYDLDICIFRAYENGQPAKIEHFLKWNTKGPADGELTFVSGHPGKTDRQLAVSELAETRDLEVPYLLNMYYRREVFLACVRQAQLRERTARAKRRAQRGKQSQTLRRLPGRTARSRDLARDRTARKEVARRDERQCAI